MAVSLGAVQIDDNGRNWPAGGCGMYCYRSQINVLKID
jgi:hypothetical protein